jgi:integrase
VTALRLVTGASNAAACDPDLKAFIDWCRDLRGLRPNTLRGRSETLGRLSEWLGKPLRDATEDDLLGWEQAAVAGRAAETRRCYVSHVRAFYRWAGLAGIVSADPARRLTNPKLARPLPRPLPEDELRAAAAAAGRPKLLAMLLLGAFCGLRCQETAGLHWSDLRSDATGHALHVRDGKGGKDRVVPVPEVVLAALVALGRRRAGPIFYGVDGRPITPNAVSRALNRLLASCGIDATAHQLRHRYGTRAYQLTKDLRLVQELLGHSSPQTTARYAAYDKSQTVDMVKAMDEAWSADPA